VPVVELVPAKKIERIRALEQRQKELEAEFEKCFPALHRKAKAMRPRPPSARIRASLLPPPDSPSSTNSGLSPIVPPPPPFTPTPGESGEQQNFAPVDWSMKKNQDQDMNDETFDRMKAPLVGHLATGLDKMREAAGVAGTPSPPIASGKDSYESAGYKDKLLEHGDYSSPPPELTDYDEIDPGTEGLKNDPAFQRAGLQGYGSGAQSGVVGMGQYDGGVGAGASVTSLGSGSGGDSGLKKSGGKRAQIWDRLRSGGK